MNIHKSDGISRKFFKKHNSIETTKVTIEDIEDIEKNQNNNKKRKVSGIRKHGIHIINNARKTKKEVEPISTEEILEYSEKNPVNNVVFDEKETIEEDDDIFFDTEDVDDKGEVILEPEKLKNANTEPINKIPEIDLQKEQEILKNVESFEKKEKKINTTIIKPIKNEKAKIISEDLDSDNDDIESIDKSIIKETMDEDGLIIKESSKDNENKIINNKNINSKNTANETVSQKHNKNLLFVIIGIIILIAILIGGFIFYKKTKEDRLNQLNKAKIEKNTEEKDKKSDLAKTNKKDTTEKDTENSKIKKEVSTRKLFSNCDYFSNNLSSCTPYSCKFEHPKTHEILEKKIVGIKDGKCNYTETLSDKKILNCHYDETSRKKVSDFYKKLIDAKFIAQTEPFEDKVNGIDNPIKTMITDNICIIEENNEILDKKCPEGKEYNGEYNNNNELAPLCIDSTFKCEESCPNCKNDKQILILNRIKGIAECKECTKSSDCKDGFHCFNNSCVTNDVLLNELSCSPENDNCKKLPCKDCSTGNKYCNVGGKNWKNELKNKCVDCTDTKYCKEGFTCENYKCISK